MLVFLRIGCARAPASATCRLCEFIFGVFQAEQSDQTYPGREAKLSRWRDRAKLKAVMWISQPKGTCRHRSRQSQKNPQQTLQYFLAHLVIIRILLTGMAHWPLAPIEQIDKNLYKPGVYTKNMRHRVGQNWASHRSIMMKILKP